MKESEKTMQKIDALVSELKTIMQSNDITQTWLVNTLKDKCSRNTILAFMTKADADPKLSTLLMILDACGVDIRFETERSREAVISGDIAAYRTETESLRAELESMEKDRDYFKSRYEKLIEKNTALTSAVEKQQGQIEKYMLRMENAENALYTAHENIQRKDARIVELSKKLGMW